MFVLIDKPRNKYQICKAGIGLLARYQRKSFLSLQENPLRLFCFVQLQQLGLPDDSDRESLFHGLCIQR